MSKLAKAAVPGLHITSIFLAPSPSFKVLLTIYVLQINHFSISISVKPSVLVSLCFKLTSAAAAWMGSPSALCVFYLFANYLSWPSSLKIIHFHLVLCTYWAFPSHQLSSSSLAPSPPSWKERHPGLMKQSLFTDHQTQSFPLPNLCLPSFTFHWIRESRAEPRPCIYVCPFFQNAPGGNKNALKTIRCDHFILDRRHNPCAMTHSKIKTKDIGPVGAERESFQNGGRGGVAVCCKTCC